MQYFVPNVTEAAAKLIALLRELEPKTVAPENSGAVQTGLCSEK